MKTITEKQIHLIGRRLNAKSDLKEMQELYDLAIEEGVEVTAEQSLKGFNWLMNEYKTPRGIERKNNPFGYREQEALDAGLKAFTYDGHFDAGNAYVSWYAPIYTYIGKDGGSFQYYVGGGKINIIG
jgi:hypothetical protein